MAERNNYIILVADEFADQSGGGAELTTEALLNVVDHNVVKILTQDLSPKIIENHKEAFWIFANYYKLDLLLVEKIVDTLNYAVIEYDLKFCWYRSPATHYRNLNKICNCGTTDRGFYISIFLSHAKIVFWMSRKQMEKFYTMCPPIKRTKNIILSSAFSIETLELIRELRLNTTKSDRWVVIGSPIWLKGKTTAEDYCKKNNLPYDVIWDKPYRELLKVLATAKGLVFLPCDSDTCPRLVIEAKLLGCELVLNENVQHKDEPWFANNNLDLIEDYLLKVPFKFWNNINELLVPLGKSLLSNCKDYDIPDNLENNSNNNTTKNSYKSINKASSIKILVQSRSNIFTARGGDTIALERNCAALQRYGANVVIDPNGLEDLKNFDLVHLYNLSTPEPIEVHARKAVNSNVPYVVTTLYEDRNSFFSEMCCLGQLMQEYFCNAYSGYNFNDIIQLLPTLKNDFNKFGILNNNFVISTANALLTSGINETDYLKRDYPAATNVLEVPFGSTGLPNIDKNLFYNKYGIKDYILCVGRIEWRKNQAMLLKALEDSNLPIVLVAGKMTYQPNYQEAVCGFQRKAKTYILSGLSEQELASAYSGALAHVLPSWFELPGLVSLEAAQFGIPVIGTKFGTLHNYLGDEAIYCDPSDINSIRNAVDLAISRTRHNENLVAKAKQFTWENSAKKLIEIYNKILNKQSKITGVNIDQSTRTSEEALA